MTDIEALLADPDPTARVVLRDLCEERGLAFPVGGMAESSMHLWWSRSGSWSRSRSRSGSW